MGYGMSKSSIEEHANWVKRLFEVSQLLAKTAQETVSCGYPYKIDTERAKDALKKGKYESKKSRFDDQ